MLTKGFLRVSRFTLILMPWTPEYGSYRVPYHTQFAHLQPINYNAIAWQAQNPSTLPPVNQHIEIEVSGIPPHLCTSRTVNRFFAGLCTFRQITFIRNNFTYFISARTSNLPSIQRIASLGIRKTTQDGSFIHIWPVWFQIAEIQSPPPAPSPQQGSSAEDPEVLREAYQRIYEEEAASRLRYRGGLQNYDDSSDSSAF